MDTILLKYICFLSEQAVRKGKKKTIRGYMKLNNVFYILLCFSLETHIHIYNYI